MDKELKDKWIKALRSGDYTQHRGSITNAKRRYDGALETTATAFCCLGVLAKVANRITYQGLGVESVQGTLVSMNDRENKSFDQIADYIEEHL